jgi:hypothetical protein
MLAKAQLRKADIFTGILFFIFGLFVVSQALQMPMKDSWGGVQNVWYVSPALFPLFVGGIIALLGLILTGKGIREVGWKTLVLSLHSLTVSRSGRFFQGDAMFRFYSICSLFGFYVYMNLPRVDFIISSQLFLVVFITIFYFDDVQLLKKLLGFYLTFSLAMLVYFMADGKQFFAAASEHLPDYLNLSGLIGYICYCGFLVRGRIELVRRFKISLAVALATPFILALVFKYFLLVPLVHEGLVIGLMDSLRYMEF